MRTFYHPVKSVVSLWRRSSYLHLPRFVVADTSLPRKVRESRILVASTHRAARKCSMMGMSLRAVGFLVDERGAIVAWSPAAAARFQLSAEAALGRKLWSLCAREDRARCVHALREALETGAAALDTRLELKQPFSARVLLTPIDAPPPRPRDVAVTIFDEPART